MSAPGASCPTCGTATPAGSRFCPECGTRLGDGDATAREELPPHETGPVPVHVTSVQPRLFGVTPPSLLLALGAAALALALYLLATGHWLVGAILLALAVLLAAAFVRVARRKPDTAVARVSAGAFDAVRARARVTAESLAVRSSVRAELARLEVEREASAAERNARLRDLGEAALREDAAAMDELRAEIARLDAEASAREERAAAIVADAEARLAHGQMEVRPTEVADAVGGVEESDGTS